MARAGVPFRGFTSLTSLYNAGSAFKALQDAGKQVYVYYFGDYDPSGTDIDRAARASLRDDFGVEIIFERVAVTPEQITTLGLPTRPTKKSDPRAKTFQGQSVEVDAMLREQLMALVEQCITQHLPPAEFRRMRAAEAAERESWNKFVAGWPRWQRRRSQ